LPIHVTIDERHCESHGTYAWAAGGRVITLSTVLPERGLAVELISTYVGHPQTDTIATHLVLGPVGHAPTIRTDAHDRQALEPIERAHECAYDHADQLIKTLRTIGRVASVTVDEHTFARLDQIE
ncbi:MAG: hypothetical protein ACRDLR_09305, partial [Gaiellaceae bacterium]